MVTTASDQRTWDATRDTEAGELSGSPMLYEQASDPQTTDFSPAFIKESSDLEFLLMVISSTQTRYLLDSDSLFYPEVVLTEDHLLVEDDGVFLPIPPRAYREFTFHFRAKHAAESAESAYVLDEPEVEEEVLMNVQPKAKREVTMQFQRNRSSDSED